MLTDRSRTAEELQAVASVARLRAGAGTLCHPWRWAVGPAAAQFYSRPSLEGQRGVERPKILGEGTCRTVGDQAAFKSGTRGWKGKMIYVTRRVEFSASHYYHNSELTPEENRRIFGKCNNPHGHGHNYTLEVTLAGEVDPRTGMVLDLKNLKKLLEAEVLQLMDHRFLKQGSSGLCPQGRKTSLLKFGICWRRNSRSASCIEYDCTRLRTCTWTITANNGLPSPSSPVCGRASLA